MPIYDYVCRNCGHTVEVIHGVNADGPSECPVCGGPVRRAVSAAAVHFKGSGWAKKERSAAKSASTSKDAGGDAVKTDGEAVKPAAETTSSAAASTASSASAEPSKSAGPPSEGP